MNLIERYKDQVNSLVDDDEALAAYVERLETMTDNGTSIDDEVDEGQFQFDFAVDSGDDAAMLTDEVEQLLREQGDGKIIGFTHYALSRPPTMTIQLV
jgi:hypothetical protein